MTCRRIAYEDTFRDLRALLARDPVRPGAAHMAAARTASAGISSVVIPEVYASRRRG